MVGLVKWLSYGTLLFLLHGKVTLFLSPIDITIFPCTLILITLPRLAAPDLVSLGRQDIDSSVHSVRWIPLGGGVLLLVLPFTFAAIRATLQSWPSLPFTHKLLLWKVLLWAKQNNLCQVKWCFPSFSSSPPIWKRRATEQKANQKMQSGIDSTHASFSMFNVVSEAKDNNICTSLTLTRRVHYGTGGSLHMYRR